MCRILRLGFSCYVNELVYLGLRQKRGNGERKRGRQEETISNKDGRKEGRTVWCFVTRGATGLKKPIKGSCLPFG